MRTGGFWASRLFWADVLVAALLGVLGALAVLAFHGAMHGLRHVLYGRTDGMVNTARALLWWHRLWIPAVGGVLAGLILQWARRLRAAGTMQEYMAVISQGNGQISTKFSCVCALSSLCTVVSGASIGREGPMVQLACMCSSALGRMLHLPPGRLRLWVACGAAAGLGAAYHAPLAAVLFVAEIMLDTFAIRVLGPLSVSAVAAHVLMQQVAGAAPLYKVPAFVFHADINMLAFAALALGAGLLAPVFVQTLTLAKKPFALLPAGALWLRLGLGGLVMGVISAFEPAVWGNGYSVVNSILQGGWLWQGLLLIALLKILATAVATGSGAVGGIFTPILLAGAALGAVFGLLCSQVWPGLAPQPVWAIVGMGAFLAANTHAPLMSAVMVFEMTGEPRMIAPLLLVSILAIAAKKLLMPKSIYTHALPPKTNRPVIVFDEA